MIPIPLFATLPRPVSVAGPTILRRLVWNGVEKEHLPHPHQASPEPRPSDAACQHSVNLGFASEDKRMIAVLELGGVCFRKGTCDVCLVKLDRPDEVHSYLYGYKCRVDIPPVVIDREGGMRGRESVFAHLNRPT